MSERPAGLAALGAVGLGVCCGLPVLLGAGALTAAVAITVGSAALALVGVLLGAVGFRRWRRRCEASRDRQSSQGVN